MSKQLNHNAFTPYEPPIIQQFESINEMKKIVMNDTYNINSVKNKWYINKVVLISQLDVIFSFNNQIIKNNRKKK